MQYSTCMEIPFLDYVYGVVRLLNNLLWYFCHPKGSDMQKKAENSTMYLYFLHVFGFLAFTAVPCTLGVIQDLIW